MRHGVALPTASLGLLLGLGTLGAAQTTPTQVACDPQAYTRITNIEPLPQGFCAYAYLPFRVQLPASPKHIDTTNTQILQREYAPNSKAGVIQVSSRKPTGRGDDASNYVTYKAQSRDPKVTVTCDKVGYGCSDGNAQHVSTVPPFQIPAYTMSTAPYAAGNADAHFAVIQPDGKVIDTYGCFKAGGWKDGDVFPDACQDGAAGGFMSGDIVTDKGINHGNINAGDNETALPVKFWEVHTGNIRHALHVFAGCFTEGRYPGTSAMDCDDPPGVPTGTHFYLALTRAQIDQQPASVIPEHMRVFAYAAHEHGVFMLDTGNGKKWFSQPLLEDPLPFYAAGGTGPSYWDPWFKAHGGNEAGDGTLKMWDTIDWSALRDHLFVLDECYARGTCDDSVPESGTTTPPTTTTPPRRRR